ncbi:phytanoyl-CoA dioxygenase family protein [Microlunatus soli]|uniref:Ectoine hydroxylase-related dioxygenase, phytanoyl-CoA dioxygenase (PhyH) family n=1 Tax=Microlunatus soli TaxID=630515 RepID=A0A1H2AQ93_9ACTN|nr:phytanoyl-CoA dioxygenase family protein [Microlunatus soli]SDT47736.1 Ectoine hydroxylase-related dioxygenase, phytanoyl-CoA dioxygenase (PhyH) family [Microlunatus soli]
MKRSTVTEAGSDTDGYPTALYRADRVADYVESIDDITESDIDRFDERGYLAVRRLLGPAEVSEVLDGLAAVLTDPRDAAVEYESWAVDRVGQATGVERMDLVHKLMWFASSHDQLARLAGDERIVQVVRRLTREQDLTMFQDMALLKPPGGGREKPWHQDNAYFNYEPGTPIVGVWIALDPATADNGCMHVLPGTHREGPRIHYRRRDWQLCDTDVDTGRDIVVPLPAGGALFFHGLIHHGTPANHTHTRRRAVQFHYLPMGTPGVADERRLELFGSEGKNVSC